MDKYQVRSCISGSGSITYDPLTGVIGGGGGGGATWGSITGTLSSQTDLQNALDLKQNESIVINSNTTAVLDGVYTVVASATFTDPTPAEGKGFMVFVRNGTATVGGTGYSTAGTVINRIFHSGAWANYTLAPTSLAIGTTPITGGTVGRVLFEGAGNVLQENAILNLDTTNGLIIGGATARGTRQTIVNAANTNASKTLVVRNAADSATMLELSGDGVLRVQSTAGFGGTISPYTSLDGFWLTGGTPAANADPTRAGIFITTNTIGMYAGGGTTLRYVLKFQTELANPSGTDWHLISGGSALSGSLYLASASGTANSKFHFTANSHFNVGAIGNSTNGTNLIKVLSGTQPTTTNADTFSMYSRDIVAGNAAPHFLTENLDVVKIYSIGGWGTPTGTLTRTTFATYTGATAGVLYDQTIMQNLIDAVKINSERLAALISDLKTGHQLLKA